MFEVISILLAVLRGRYPDLRQKSMPFSLAGLIIAPLAFVHLGPVEMAPLVSPIINPVILAAMMAGSMFLFYFYYWDIIKKRYRHPRAIMIGGMAMIGAIAFANVGGTVAVTFVTSALDYGLYDAGVDFFAVIRGEMSWDDYNARYYNLLVLKGGWILMSAWMNYMVFSTVDKDYIECGYRKLRKRFPRLPE